MDALSQIHFGGCRAECLLHPLRLQERVLPAGSSGTGRPEHGLPGWPQEGEPVCRPAHHSGIPRWPTGSLLG